MRRDLRALRLVFVVVCGVFSACSGDGDDNVLSVSVATGLVPGPEFTYVQTEVTPAAEGAASLPLQEARAIFSDAFERGHNVATFHNLVPGTYLVIARLLRTDGTVLVSRRVQIELFDDFALVVHLTRDCVGAVCPSPGGSPALNECLGGHCVDPRCNPPDPTFCPDVTFCLRDEDCIPSSACSTAVCTGGVCEDAPNPDACGPVDAGMPDAGETDASESDAGQDAATQLDLGTAGVDAGSEDGAVDAAVPSDAGPLCGTLCIPESDPCLFGYWDCSAGPAVCTEINFKPAGSPCGGGRTCSPEHECIFCNEGEACGYACYAGIETCTDGIRSCSIDGTLKPAGSPYSDDYCYSDMPCGTGLVCDASGNPTDCVEGADCGEGCETGHFTCDVFGAHCVLDDVAPAGTLCGFRKYCDAAGECVSCTPGATCTPPMPLCQTGSTDCSAGTPVCIPTNRPVATSCGFFDGSNHTCAADGSCNACNHGEACITDDICRDAHISCGTGVPVCYPTVNGRLDPGTTCDVDKVCDWDFTCKHCVPGETCAFATGCSSGTHTCDFFSGAACGGTSVLLAPGTPCATGQCNGADRCCAPITASAAPGAISVSAFVGCHITADTTVHCMPNDYNLSGTTNAASVSVGYSHVCALLLDGSVSCWGNNDLGQLGFVGASATTAVAVALPGTVYHVKSGALSTCAIVGSSRNVYCWGDEEAERTNGMFPTMTPTMIPGVAGAVELAVDWSHYCARLTSGDVMCWGYNFSGELGIGSMSSVPVSTPTLVVGLHDAVDIDLASSRSCAVRATGGIVCWGASDTGGPNQTTPMAQTLPFSDAQSVEITTRGTRCARRAGGEIWCWGRGDIAGIGYEASSMPISPTAVHFIASATDFEMDDEVGCAIMGSGHQPICWGNNNYNQFSLISNFYYEPILVCP